MRTAALLAAALALAACAEINKPIGPNDPWREKAISMDASRMR